jgi:hypothetical protein
MKFNPVAFIISRKSLRCKVVFVAAGVLITSGAPAQNLFVANYGGGDIVEFTPGGVQSTFASLSYARTLGFNSAGNLFVPDGTSVYEYTSGGVQSTFVSGVGFPQGIAFDSSGNLYLGSSGGYIYEFTPAGVQSTFADVGNSQNGLAFNSAGDLFDADPGTGSVYEFTPGGVKTTFASGLDAPVGLAFNNAGDLFVSDEGSGDIYEYTPGGAKSTFASGLSDPAYIAFQDEVLPLPEPPTLALAGLGGLSLMSFLRLRKQAICFPMFLWVEKTPPKRNEARRSRYSR